MISFAVRKVLGLYFKLSSEPGESRVQFRSKSLSFGQRAACMSDRLNSDDLSHGATIVRQRLRQDAVVVPKVKRSIQRVCLTMPENLIAAHEAASRLAMSVTSLYDWLSLSDQGMLVIRGQRATIHYFQGEPRGQGRIKLEVAEIERIKELMRVRPRHSRQGLAPIRHDAFPGITVPLGRPRS